MAEVAHRKRHRIAVLGSTGSIGRNALEVIAHLGKPYEAVALSACRSVDALRAQAEMVKPKMLGLADETAARHWKLLKKSDGAELFFGPSGLEQIAAHANVDTVLAAIVGAAGLPPVLAAVRAGKRVALANKESLVIAGSILMPEALRCGAEILPVDSEHSAIFQALACGRGHEVQRVILTASGGPFRGATAEQIENATVESALRHPTWSMGGKITIDSATMFNKALEVIEACWLFDLPPEKVQVVVHPQSIIHSMVEFQDGSTIAQLSPPDMKLPIQYALTYPQRVAGNCKRLDFADSGTLHFEPPNMELFPALRLGFEAAAKRGTMGAVLNAANESAVAAFTAGRIRFGMISRVVEVTMQNHRFEPNPDLGQLLEADREARLAAENLIARC